MVYVCKIKSKIQYKQEVVEHKSGRGWETLATRSPDFGDLVLGDKTNCGAKILRIVFLTYYMFFIKICGYWSYS